MSYFARLRDREHSEGPIQVAVVGAGFVGRGLVYQLDLTPGMRPALIVNRTVENALSALDKIGIGDDDVVVSDDVEVIESAIAAGVPAVTTDHTIIGSVDAIDVVAEVTGAVEYGAIVARNALENGKHVISMSFETDATVGPLLAAIAAEHGVVYSGSDGDQPGVMNRLVDYVRGIGLGVVAAVNCKGFLDVHATPDSIREFAVRQKTSLPMTTAFTDGTKMNVENACVANASGLVPARRGMNGVESTLADALDDFAAVLDREGVVDYTLGGDFRAGVFVIGKTEDADAAHYLDYLKMGKGPWYMFYRPWHLVHMETPLSIAEAVLDGQPTLAPGPRPVVEVVTIAKRDLKAGERLDGIGGYSVYGEIDTVERAAGLLPIGISAQATMVRPVSQDHPVTLDDVTLDEDSPLIMMRAEQEQRIAARSAVV